ncbi:Protein CBG11824 [Caenorhabditis briggsae]|uniref:Protein CBG11824 n=1 Tax=Caenorhabditis briggsae TaxID=6238 RepID=A8XE41_CAEBR|nr:Protein CBG11824 [Caenorhabditis briggsae]CAP30913.1 Protein CBG11824 [Caenorhabditis briggsae]
MLTFKSLVLLLVLFSTAISAKKRAIKTEIQKTTIDSVKIYVEDHASRLQMKINKRDAPAKNSGKISLTTASPLVMTRRERFRMDFINGMFPANSWTLGLVVGAVAVFSVIKNDLTF